MPSALAATWGEPSYPPLADPVAMASQPEYPDDSVGWVPDELRGRRDLLFYRQQDLGYGRTLVSFNPETEDAPVIPGLTMASEGMQTYRASPADPWTSERIYVSADPLGRANAIDQGNGVWSYPVSLADNIEVRELPPITTQDEFQSKAEQGTFDRWNEFGNAVTNGNWRRAWDAFNFVRNDADVYRARLLKPTPAQEKFANNFGMAIVAPQAIGIVGVGAYSLGSTWIGSQLAMQPATGLSATPLLKGMATSGLISTTIYGFTHWDESTPAGIAVAFGGGAVGGGLVKQGLNYAAALPNTAIPFTYSNAVTQATGVAYGFGTFKWLNVGNVTATGNSWWTTPIFVNTTEGSEVTGQR